MKKAIMATMVAACIALCAAVWPQSNVVEETHTQTLSPAVRAPEATVAELKTEIESKPLAEKENAIEPQMEIPQELHTEPEPAPMETPTVPETQLTLETEVDSVVDPEPIPEPTPESAEEQTTDTPQSGDMVYVPGFGWIENQGPNKIDYAEDMYENGNKIGNMG